MPTVEDLAKEAEKATEDIVALKVRLALMTGFGLALGVATGLFLGIEWIKLPTRINNAVKTQMDSLATEGALHVIDTTRAHLLVVRTEADSLLKVMKAGRPKVLA